ncbi:hypothetical protein EMIT091MI3_80018 [Kosakonia quasisacchari]
MCNVKFEKPYLRFCSYRMICFSAFLTTRKFWPDQARFACRCVHVSHGDGCPAFFGVVIYKIYIPVIGALKMGGCIPRNHFYHYVQPAWSVMFFILYKAQNGTKPAVYR